MATILTCLAAFFFQPTPGLCQDGHYWTEQFGARSILLNGVVIGSVEDLGAVYYNPARLAQVDNPSFLLSGRVYQLNTLKIEDGAGDNIDLSQSVFGGAPTMVAGTFELGFLEGHRFAYSFLTRYSFNADFFIHDEETGDIVEIWPGEEMYSGEFHLDRNLKEEWLGLSWAFGINNHWGVGITNFVSIRNQGEDLSTEIQALSETNDVALLRTSRGIDYQHIGLLWKLALAYQRNNLTAGLSITTPKIGLRGKGSSTLQDFYSGPKGIGVGKLKDTYVNDYQQNLHARHRSPWAIGFGAGYRLGKNKIHLSAEWYGHVSRYTLVQSDPFVGQSNQNTYLIELVDELNAVINFGVGFELYINPKFSSFASFATDFSAVRPEVVQYIERTAEANASMIKADIYQLGGGFITNTKWFELTLGASYAFANQMINRPFQFPEDEGDLVGQPDEQSRMYLGRWKFIVGFTIPFLKNKTEFFENE